MKRLTETAATVFAVLSMVTVLPITDSRAQGYPARPIRIVLPVVAGGNLDLISRPLAQKITESLGQQVIVENRAGGSGIIGTQFVARSAPDGYTFLTIGSNFVTTPILMADVPTYDPLRDFMGVSMFALIPQVVVVHPSLPVHSVKQLIALAKAHPGELNYASGVTGSSGHLAAELFSRQAGIRMTRIAYKGGGQAKIDLISGHVSLMFDNISTSIPNVRAGQLRLLAVTTPNRSPLLADIPTVGESLPGYTATQFNGMFAPAKTPAEIVSRMHAEIVKFVGMPDVKNMFSQQGIELASSSTPEQFNEFVKAEYARWAKVIREAGIKAD